MEIILEIKKEDILNSEYMDSEGCAITKALIRAGYTTFSDSGLGIREGWNFIFDKYNSNYTELFKKVVKMYGFGLEKMEPEDFTFILKHNGN
jgi:hypothetical protein